MMFNHYHTLMLNIPERIYELCYNISIEFGTEPVLTIPMFITTMSSLLQGKFDVACDIEGEQIIKTPLTIFTMVIAESGTGKTPVTRKLLEPLDNITKDMNISIEKNNNHAIEMNRIIEMQIRNIRNLAKKRNKEDVEQIIEEIISLNDKCEKKKAYFIPYVNNTTEAGIRKYISEQEGNRISILDSDGGSTKLLLQDTRLTSILNQGYDHEVITVARAGKSATETLQGYISWATYMQPAKFERLAQKQDLWMDGCLARVLPFFLDDTISTNTKTGKSVPAMVYDYYVKKIEYLVKYPWNRDHNGKIIPYIIRLEMRAAYLWEKYAKEFERLANHRKNREIAPWLIKCKATLLKLAAIFHVYETDEAPEQSLVRACHVEYAYRFLIDLIPYVEHLRETVAPTPEETVMKKIIHWLYSRRDNPDFQLRELYQGTHLKMGPVSSCINNLVDDHVLYVSREPYRGYRGRPTSKWYTINRFRLLKLYPEEY